MNTISPIIHTSVAMTDHAQQVKDKKVAEKVGVDYHRWDLFVAHCRLSHLYPDLIRKAAGVLTDDEIKELRKKFGEWDFEASSY
ncbi:hypothetical protein [Alteromonas macleodii]|uniref:hypothetical protein n=1 Tax=Alteromonas macleodii TaxID=28108 RepID=UPI00313D7C1D